MEVGNPDADSLEATLSMTQRQLHFEMECRKEATLEMNNLRNRLKTLEGEKEDGTRHGELTRKAKLLEEQVQYLEKRLESCRQEGALKLSSIEGLLGNENSKLKAREKDLRRKLQRERETNKQLTQRVGDLTIELRQIQKESKKHEVHHTGWMKHVRLPGKGEWPAIKLDTQQNKKALRHIFEQVEKEGGPPVNLNPSLFLHCVVLFLWWKREATVKTLDENEAITGRNQTKFEIEELRGLNMAFQQRVRALEDTLGDCRMERQNFETTMSTTLNQLLTEKYDLSNKVARLEDTVSALHLDNNLLRAEVNDRSASQQAKMKLDQITAELKSRLQASESELRETRLHKEQMDIEMRQVSKRLHTLEQDALIQETVCKEHTERIASGNARRAELETMTSELQAKTWSLQHNLQNLEESRDTLRKERDSFLGQLTKALDQLEDSRTKIQEQDHQVRRMLNDRAHTAQELKRNDEMIGSLRRDLANHRGAQAELIEEKEKRRSLEAMSTNHERLVREMEQRVRNEEVDSATLLAELCGAHTEERERLEGKIETLEMEREDMVDAIETLSNDKTALHADVQQLKLELERVSEKLHTVIKRQARRALHRPGQAARRPGVYTDAWTTTDPSRERDSPVSEKELDGPEDRRTRELEELVDLLVTVKGSAFSRLMLRGIEGGVSGLQDIQEDDCEGLQDADERKMNILRNEEEAEDNVDEQHRSVEIRQVQRDIVFKLRALALMMKARQKLRGRGDLGRGLGEVKGHADPDEKPHQDSDPEYPELVHEPLTTKEERPLLFSPNKPNVSSNEDNQAQKNARSSDVMDGERQTLGQHQSVPSDGIDSRHGMQVKHRMDHDENRRESDQSSTESENEDLLSTLERERERLKKELAEIKDTEARVQEHLEQEQEAHLLYLRRVNEYEEECARMQQEKEELLREPSVEDTLDETSIDGRQSTLDQELEKMFLEELESLKAENELLMSERFEQQGVLEDSGISWLGNENGQDITSTPPKPNEELRRQRKEKGDNILGLDDQLQSQTKSLNFDTKAQVAVRQFETVAERREQRFHRSPQQTNKTSYHPNQLSRQQRHTEGFINQSHEDKTPNELSTSLRKTETQQTKGGRVRDSADRFEVGNMASDQQDPGLHLLKSEVSLLPVYGPSDPLSEFERPVQKTLVSRQETSIISAHDALEQTHRQLEDQRSQSEEVMSYLGESENKIEADQPREHCTSEPRQQGIGRQNQGNLSRQNAVSEHQSVEPELDTLKGQHSKESDSDGQRPGYSHQPISSGRDTNVRSKRHLQKQSSVGDSDQPSGIPTPGCNSLQPNMQGNTRDLCQVSHSMALEELRNGDQMFEHSVYPDDQKCSPNERDDIGQCRERDVSVTPSREYEGCGNFSARKKAGASGKALKMSQAISALSSQQNSKQNVITKPAGSSSMVSLESNPKGVNDKMQILRGRRIPDAQRKEAVTFSDQNQRYVDPISKQQSIKHLPKNMQQSQTSSEDSQSYIKELERELSESRAALLELHKDRQKSQDQLTEALQKEVKLQKLVDGLRSKVDCLQVSLNKSAELVVSLEADKEYLESNHTAAQEERRRIREDLARVTKINKDLEEKLVSNSKQGELLKKKHDVMKKRYESATDKNIELKNQVVRFQRAGKESETPVSESSRPVHQPVSLSANEDKQSASSHRRKSDGTVATVQSVPGGSEFPTRVQLGGGSNLAADKMKEAQFEAARREIQVLGETNNLLESENERLQMRRLADAEKRLALQKEISELRSLTPHLRNKALTDTTRFQYSDEGQRPRLNDTHLKRQVEELMDRIFDLENQVDDSQAAIQDLERERNILQDDFTSALQKQSQLRTQLRKSEDRCKLLMTKLEDNQSQVQSLKDEMGGYLEQDSQMRDEEVRLLKKKLRELRVDCRQRSEELAEAKLRAENLEVICKMHSNKQKKDEIYKVELEAELHELRVENQDKTRKLLELEIRNGDFDTEGKTHKALTMIDRKHSNPTSGRSDTQSTASKQSIYVTSEQSLEEMKNEGHMILGANQGESYGGTSRREGQIHTTEGLDYQLRDVKETTEENAQGFESARADIVECSNRLQELEQKYGASLRDLQEEIAAQTNNITRLRESTEARLQEAVDITKVLTGNSHQAIATMVKNDLALRLKDAHLSTGQRLAEMRKLLERSITEQRKQAASLAQLQQTQEKALLQHSALKIRLRQQTDKTSGALSSWERERQSLKRQLGEVFKSLKLIEKRVSSAVDSSKTLPELEAVQDRLVSQQEGHMRGLVRIIQNCPCRRQNGGFSVSLQTTKDKQKVQQKDDVVELKKANKQILLDLKLSSESLELKKKKCRRLQESLQDACLKETELTSSIRQLQDQVKAEVEMQAKLAKRSEDQEAEIFRLRSALGKQSFKEDTSTSLSQEPSTRPNMTEMLTDFSREIQGHLESHMEKTQLQNETDDRKKIQELERHLSNMDAQLSVDKITVQSLTDDNRRLRTMVYKLRERIASNQMSHFKDSRMDAVYQALARAQVRVIATSMADGTQTVLTGTDAYGNTAMTSFGTSRLAEKRHMGSVGNSLGDSYD